MKPFKLVHIALICWCDEVLCIVPTVMYKVKLKQCIV